MRRGIFISFEGIDSVGKSTQVQLLGDYLREKGIEALVVREPGSTEISEKIRDILADNANLGKIEPMTEFLLYSASRSQLVRETIKPALDRGETVLTDRYYDSSTAYQGYGRGIDINFIEAVNMNVICDLIPDLTVLLTVDISRINSSDDIRRFLPDLFDDRLEREFLEFRNRVQAGFIEIANREPDRFLMLNASGDRNKIAKRIATRTDKLLKDKL